jgi:DNA-binding MarR family transcriptional regulator
MIRTTFTELQKEEILKLYSEGLWLKDIAPKYGCAVCTLTRCFKEWGVEVVKRMPTANLSNKEVGQLVAFYHNGLSLSEIEERLPYKRCVLTKALREKGYVIRRRGKPQKLVSTQTEKQCSNCKQVKLVTDFTLHSTTYDGLQPSCRQCSNEVGKWLKLKQKFNLTQEEYESMLLAQNGVCDICKRTESRIKFGKPTMLAVDHCHITGKVRGLLCHNCNIGIGNLGDNITVVANALDYLKRHT